MPDARWRIQDDGHYLCLQIEFGNDYAVTLTIEDGEPGPSVNLWHASGECGFEHYTRARFRAWLDDMVFSGETPP